MYIPLPEEESEKLIVELFQALPEMLATIAPSGFANSDLVPVFHPDKQQQYKEYCEIKLRFQELFKRKETDKEKDEPLKSFEEFILEIEESEVDETYEVISIFGDCIWDVFSNNHTVYNKDFKSYDLGSF